MSKKQLLYQGIFFVFTSGLGWIIDFFTYALLVYLLNVSVGYANYMSAIPAITFVFVVSTRKIFKKNRHGMPLIYKYLIYVSYQMVFISLMSYLNYRLFLQLSDQTYFVNSFLGDYLAMVSKVLITPVTLGMNLFVTKFITEKL